MKPNWMAAHQSLSDLRGDVDIASAKHVLDAFAALLIYGTPRDLGGAWWESLSDDQQLEQVLTAIEELQRGGGS